MCENSGRFYIVCEGKSEMAYLQLLNRFLSDWEIPLNFCFVLAGKNEESGGGQVSLLKQGWHKLQKNFGKAINRRTRHRCFIWADRDLYIRDDHGCRDAYERERDNLPHILFNGQNFEDFFSLHLPLEKAHEWCVTCNGLGHFTFPLHSSRYKPLFVKLVPGYKKSSLSDEFDIKEGLRNLRKNTASSRILQTSDFARFLLEELASHWTGIFDDEESEN